MHLKTCILAGDPTREQSGDSVECLVQHLHHISIWMPYLIPASLHCIELTIVTDRLS